jgi:hypothetical protein
MSAEPRALKLDLAALGIKASSADTLIAAPEISQKSPLLSQLTIPAFGVFIGTIHSGH